MKTFYVYAILNPTKPGGIFGGFEMQYEPFYIGKGSGKRIQMHVYDKNDSMKNRIMRKINSKGFEPTYIILKDNLTEQESFNLEIELISLIGRASTGGILSNMTDGGEGSSGWIPTEQEIERRKKAATGKNNPMYGKPTKGFLGHSHSEDTKRNISERAKQLSTVHKRTSYKSKVFIEGKIYNSLREAERETGYSRTRLYKLFKLDDPNYKIIKS